MISIVRADKAFIRLSFLVFFFFSLIFLSFPNQVAADTLTPIMGQTSVTKEQLIKYFQNNNSVRSLDYINQFVTTTIDESNIEGVRAEVAFALMMKETNFLKFTGTVQESQNNFGGLGVTGPGVPGASYDTIQLGIRAVIQHLQAYATTLTLIQPVIDTRYSGVTRGCAPYVEWLGTHENPIGKGWATDPGYGSDIVLRVNQIKAILPMRMWVDSPNNGSTIRGTVNILGWALNASGVTQVEIFYGNKSLGLSTLNVSNPSVDTVFPGYPSGKNSGFTYSLDTTKLPNGPIALRAVATGSNTETLSWPINVTVANNPTRMWADTPNNGSTIHGTVNVSGWALNVSGISQVEIFNGSQPLGLSTLNISNPSVDTVFPGYPSGKNSGFTYSLDTTKLPNGPIALRAVATGNNAETLSWPINVTVANNPARMWVDTPNNGSTIRSTVNISGWALNMSGITRVEIFYGNQSLGLSTLNISHPSVDAAFPGYPSGKNSGFSYSLDTTKLPNGPIVLRAVATGNNAETISFPINVTVDNGPKMWLDTPNNGSTIRGTVNVSGWALNMSGVSRVEIFYGNKSLGLSTLNVSNPSVDTVFPGYPSGKNSGFSYSLDTTKLPNGSIALRAVATGNNAETLSWPINVTVANGPARMWVDTPSNSSTIRGTVSISGWALNMSGITQVEIFYGNKSLGLSTLNIPHPSVDTVFPGYPSGKNSGFTYSLDTTKLPNGPIALRAVATGNNAVTISFPINVTVDNGPKMWLDTPNNGSTIRGTVNVSGWALNMSGISQVEIFYGNKSLGLSTLNVSNPSVDTVFPGYPSGKNSGFTYSLDTTKLPNGPIALRVVATGNNAETLSWPINVTVANNPARMWVDTPSNGSTIRGTTNVLGWALNISGITQVEIFYGNQSLGLSTLNVSNPSVDTVFPGYPSGMNSGFSYSLDTTKLPNGPIVLRAVATGNNGETISFLINVKIDNIPKMWLDTPIDGANIKDTTMISGWALNMSGISKVEVFDNNTLLGTATLNIFDPSVNAVYPGYPSGEYSGFSYALDTLNLAKGFHTLKVIATGTNGETTSFTIKVNVAREVIVLDPGHGGSDPGAISADGLNEKDVNLAVALKLRDILQSEGYTVKLTRDSDKTVSLDDRVSFANASGADIFLSIHSNALDYSGSPWNPNDPNDPRNVTGVLGTYFHAGYEYGSIDEWPYDPEAEANWKLNQALANSVSGALSAATSQVQKSNESHAYQVLRLNQVPASLIEIGFLSNPPTAALMRTSNWQTLAAQGISTGIDNYSSSLILR